MRSFLFCLLLLLSIPCAAALISGYFLQWNGAIKVRWAPGQAVYLDGGAGEGRVLTHVQLRAAARPTEDRVQFWGWWEFREPTLARSLWQFSAHRMVMPLFTLVRRSWTAACPIWCLLLPCLVCPGLWCWRQARAVQPA